MAWYPVTKTINGCQYVYLQTTYREGGTVKTTQPLCRSRQRRRPLLPRAAQHRCHST